MRFNVNGYVRVRLTPLGRQIHQEHWAPHTTDIGREYRPAEETDGWSEWQMWELMQLYGSHIGNGLPLPFETEIEIIEQIS